jgi:hypothetical protein
VSHPNYATPEIFLTPDTGYPTAPFKVFGQFFAAGDRAASTFTDAGTTSGLGSATADASGHFSLMTKVPGSARAGVATVTSKGSSGTATAPFTVPSS